MSNVDARISQQDKASQAISEAIMRGIWEGMALKVLIAIAVGALCVVLWVFKVIPFAWVFALLAFAYAGWMERKARLFGRAYGFVPMKKEPLAQVGYLD